MRGYYQEFSGTWCGTVSRDAVSNECAYTGPDPEKVFRLYTALFQLSQADANAVLSCNQDHRGTDRARRPGRVPEGCCAHGQRTRAAQCRLCGGRSCGRLLARAVLYGLRWRTGAGSCGDWCLAALAFWPPSARADAGGRSAAEHARGSIAPLRGPERSRPDGIGKFYMGARSRRSWATRRRSGSTGRSASRRSRRRSCWTRSG